MDFKTQVIGAQGLSGVGAEALLVLVSGQQVPEGLDPALADALSAAVKDGDFAFKVGDKYELVLDMGSMFVVKGPGGREAIVGKDVFKIAKDEA